MEGIGRPGKYGRASDLPFQELFAGLSWGGYTRIHAEKPAKGLLSGVGCWGTLKAARAGRAHGIRSLQPGLRQTQLPLQLPTSKSSQEEKPPSDSTSTKQKGGESPTQSHSPKYCTWVNWKVAATSLFRGQNKLQVPARPRQVFPSTQRAPESNAGMAERRCLLC